MSETIDQGLPESLFADFALDNGVRRGLPAGAYWESDFWRREQARVFDRSWVLAGFVHELTEPGQAIPTRVGGRPIVLLRNAEGDIRVFHNVCRHRCLTLVDGAQKFERGITCPYHNWTYDLNGALRATPFFGGPKQHRPADFDPKDHGLVAVRHFVWHDWIFVNLDGAAPPFADYAAEIMGRVADVDMARFHPVAMLDFGEVATNWKFLMENFMEPYHVQYVHKTTTDQPLKDHHTVVDGLCLGSAVDIAPSRTEAAAGRNSLAVTSRYLTLFPSFVLGTYAPDQMGVYLNQPVAPGVTRQKRAIYLIDGDTRPESEVAALRELWAAVHQEDHDMCVRLQSGRASPVADGGGVLSPHWEDSVRRFQELVVEAVR